MKTLRLLGLAYKAGRLAVGLEAVCKAGPRVTLFFLARDAGAAAAREIKRIGEASGTPLLSLPYSREELGQTLGGKGRVSALALTDRGFAEAILKSNGRKP